MTSDGISTEDWDRVHELALNIVNAIDGEDQAPYDELFSYLAHLRSKYGERASILATEGDYADNPREAERLYVMAFNIAAAAGDIANVREIALSLAYLHANAIKDAAAASRWLEIAAPNITAADLQSTAEYASIQEDIEQLRRLS